MSDPRRYQRDGAYTTHSAMDLIDEHDSQYFTVPDEDESNEVSEGESAERDDFEALADYVE